MIIKCKTKIRGIKIKYTKHNHSVSSIYLHIVLVVKYRRRVITTSINDYLYIQCLQMAEFYGILIEEWNHDNNHIHMLVRTNHSVTISDFIRDYKSMSSREVKKNFDVTSMLRGSSFWSRCYFVCSTGGVTIDVIKKYIAEQ